MKNLIGQHMMIGIAGTSLSQTEKKFITENDIGGVCLFARNVVEPQQIFSLCKELQDLRNSTVSRLPLFIAIDMEGGRVARLKAPFTQWPPLKKVGDLDSPTVAFQFAYDMGMELKAVGINVDFAPCVDVFTNPKNTVIGDRSLSSDPEKVGKLASALVRGYIKSGILPCAKHFPGHGNTLLDSHEDLPVESVDKKRLEDVELIPFKRSFRARLDLLMTAHITFDKVDAQWPVTLSETFLKKILREDLRYRGLIFTDDLDMKALAKNYDKADIPVRALKAGADILLYCNEPDSPPVAIESVLEALAQGSLQKSDLEVTYRRITDFKKQKLTHLPTDFQSASKWIGHGDHKKLADAILQGSVPAGLIQNSREDEA